MAAISGTIGLEKSTAENYIKLLEAVFLIYRLSAWGTTLGSRVAKHLTPEKIAQAVPAALTDYAHLLETFAVGEILKQASWSEAPVTTGHFRTEAGEEVDLVVERDDGQVIAFEIKAGTRIDSGDLRGLRRLKDRLGTRLQEAIVLYTGVHAYSRDDWIRVLPPDRLWVSGDARERLGP